MKRARLLSLVAGGFVLAALLWLRAKPASPSTVIRQPLASLNPATNAPPAPQPESNVLLQTPSVRADARTQDPGPKTADSPRPRAVTAFSDWAEHYLAGDSTVSATQGEALAWQRREAMRELIETNPEQALALTVPFRWRRALPPNITRHFEQRVDGRGNFEVAVATQFESGASRVYRWAQIRNERYDAFVFGRRLSQRTQANIPLHGIALAGKLALHPDPIRILEADEAAASLAENGQTREPICGVSGQSATARNEAVAGDIGGEISWFCGVDHLRLVQTQWQLAESGGGVNAANLVAGGASTWTQGRKNVLYLRVNFPDDLTEPLSEASAYSIMDDVNEFYVNCSYDTTWLTTTVTPLLTLPHPKVWYTTQGPGALLAEAREAARQAGYDTVNYERDIVSHTSVPTFDWGGLAFVGGKGTWLQSYGAGVTSHELGHNYGLWHANFWNTLTNDFSVIGPGTNTEYGNVFDTMGNAAAGNNQFNADFKNILGWLPDDAVHQITSNGVYRIYPFDAAQRVNGKFYAAKVRKDFQRDYWLEFRQRFTGNPFLQNGILLDWSAWTESNAGSQLLDTTPETVSRNDAAVVIGRTFTDDAAGVFITPLARGAATADPWIDVQVNTGPFPGNWAPVLKVEIDRTNAAPGQLVHLHATASDLNGDALAYAWSFDDGTFSITNQPWVSQSWGAPGEHVARCVVSDMKGGAASANVLVPVGAAAGYRIIGAVLDANDDP
ncbi:MAG: PKD domain-containing protein, partial [Verrucomicrobia bacterium]